MKKAIILSGAHHTGKSLTIRQHLKPMLGITPDAHKFTLNGKSGFIMSQSFEESGKEVEELKEKILLHSHYALLVIASRPASEKGSLYHQLRLELAVAKYAIFDFNISKPVEAPKKAQDIFDELKK